MNNYKKIASLLLALAMVIAMSATAFAATVNLPGDASILKDHTFTAYQIFSGDENEGVLSNVDWGSGIDSVAFLNALKADTTYGVKFATCTNAADVATVLGENNTNSDMAKAVAKIAYANKTGSGTVLTSGVNNLADGYYLIVDSTANVGEGGAYNAALLQVVGDVNVTVKTDVPKVEKKVKDINDSDDASIADNEWQDSADHDIGDDVPFKLTATLPNNVSAYDSYTLVFHDTMSKGLTYNGDAVVKIDGKVVADSNYVINTEANNEGGTYLTVRFNDVKLAGATDNSVVTVEYTAELNEGAVIGSQGNPNKVYLEYSDNPNDSGAGTNNTPEDVVIVFTYKVVVNKYDEKGNKLEGAGFTLYKKNVTTGLYDAIGEELKGEALTTFTWSGLDDGNYKLSETTTPDGYNTIADIEFTVTATHDIESDNPILTSLSGETKTGEITFTSNTDAGSLTTDVENRSGSTLPETGGIGTTIFYVLGTVLVLGAVVLLIAKKRASVEK